MALAAALAAHDGGRSALTQMLWAEALRDALESLPPPRTFRELGAALERSPRRGDDFRELVLLVREQMQGDPRRTFDRLLDAPPGQDEDGRP